MKSIHRWAAPLAAASITIFLGLPPAAADQSGDSHDFAPVNAQLDAYLARYHDPAFNFDPRDLRGRFSYQPGGGADRYGSCDMVYNLAPVGELESHVSAAGRPCRREEVDAALACFLGRCVEVLGRPDALLRWYGGNPYDLPGALIGIAEADEYFQLTRGASRLHTPRPWRSVLDTICWL